MTLFYVLCLVAPIALLLTGLVRTGNNSSVLEAMERSGVGTKKAAPIAPQTKFAPEAEVPAVVTPIIDAPPAESTVPAAA